MRSVKFTSFFANIIQDHPDSGLFIRKKLKGGQELLPQEMISDLACCSALALRVNLVNGIQPA